MSLRAATRVYLPVNPVQAENSELRMGNSFAGVCPRSKRAYLFQLQVAQFIGEVFVAPRRHARIVPRIPRPKPILRLLKQHLMRLPDLVRVKHRGLIHADLAQSCAAIVEHWCGDR